MSCTPLNDRFGRVLSLVAAYLVMYQLCACPCACVEHNHWLTLLGDDHEASSPCDADDERGASSSAEDHHDCDQLKSYFVRSSDTNSGRIAHSIQAATSVAEPISSVPSVAARLGEDRRTLLPAQLLRADLQVYLL